MFKGKDVRVLFRLGLSLTIKRDSKSLREISLLAVPTIVKLLNARNGVMPTAKMYENVWHLSFPYIAKVTGLDA